jgi:hypothetical protein
MSLGPVVDRDWAGKVTLSLILLVPAKLEGKKKGAAAQTKGRPTQGAREGFHSLDSRETHCSYRFGWAKSARARKRAPPRAEAPMMPSSTLKRNYRVGGGNQLLSPQLNGIRLKAPHAYQPKQCKPHQNCGAATIWYVHRGGGCRAASLPLAVLALFVLPNGPRMELQRQADQYSCGQCDSSFFHIMQNSAIRHARI